MKNKYRDKGQKASDEELDEAIRIVGSGLDIGSRRRIPLLAVCRLRQRHLPHHGIALDQHGVGSSHRRIIDEFIKKREKL